MRKLWFLFLLLVASSANAQLPPSGDFVSTGVTLSGTQTISGAKTFSAALLTTGDLQTTAGQKLTFDGATGAKYFSSNGTTLTLTGLTLTSSLTVTSTIAGGGGSGTAVPAGVLSIDCTSASNSGTGETDLISYSVPASTLNATGRAIRITAWGTYLNNNNSKTVSLYFGATQLQSFNGTFNNTGFMFQAVVVRLTATTQTAMTNWGESGSNTRLGKVTSPGETLSGAVTAKLTGQSGTQSGDVTGRCFMVEMLN